MPPTRYKQPIGFYAAGQDHYTLMGKQNYSLDDRKYALESASKIVITDLVGEGPIEGLVDQNGYDISTLKAYENNPDIFKGVYYNDIPVLNTYTNEYNYVNAGISFKFGRSVQDPMGLSSSLRTQIEDMFGLDSGFSFSNPSVVYDYKKQLFPISNAVAEPSQMAGNDQRFSHAHATKGRGGGVVDGQRGEWTSAFNQRNFHKCFGVAHEVKGPNTGFLIISLIQSTLFSSNDDGDTLPLNQYVGISLTRKQSQEGFYLFHKLRGIATSPYAYDIWLDIRDAVPDDLPVVKIYNFSEKLDPANARKSRNMRVNFITEVDRSNYAYPNSCYVVNQIDGRSIGNLPARSYDLKLLKVKVPDTYDSYVNENYSKTFNGKMDTVLRWTNNPAWIMYDILTNDRYGVAKYSSSVGASVDKWSAYEIARYCDELVKTNNRSKFGHVKICELADRNTICLSFSEVDALTAGSNDLDTLFGKRNSSEGNTEIHLMNLKFYDPVKQSYYYKCFKGHVVDIDKTNNFITIAKDFSLYKMMNIIPELYDIVNISASSDNLIAQDDRFKDIELGENTSDSIIFRQGNDGATSKKLILARVLTKNPIYNNAIAILKSFIMGESNGTTLDGVDPDDLKFFTEDELNYYIPNSGEAALVFESDGYFPLVEPRFTANLWLSNQAQVLELIDNLSTIFRGITYWNDFALNFSVDKEEDPTYAFTNSSVKDGIFGYSGSSKDTRYTVCKVIFSDKYNKFLDKTIYVEDYKGIRDYGYIEREIIGFGITSESQARRIARWFLLTNQIESESVTFTCGEEATLLDVGDVITISDKFKLAGQKSGRVHSYNKEDSFEVVLDNRYDFLGNNDKITFILSYPEEEDSYSAGARSGYLYTFFISAVEVYTDADDFRSALRLEVDTADDLRAFNLIRKDTSWLYQEKYDSDLSYTKEYRVISIKEKENSEFEVSAIEYTKGKFDYLDFDADLTLPVLAADNVDLEQTVDYASFDLLTSVNEASVNYLDQGLVLNDSRNPDLPQRLDSGLAKTKKLIDALLEMDLPWSGEDTYDYVFYADYLYKQNYSKTFRKAVLNFEDFYLELFRTGAFSTAHEFSELRGLIVEIIIGDKKLSIRWDKTEDDSIFTFAYPVKLLQDHTLDIRAYKLGPNNQIVPPGVNFNDFLNRST